MVARVQRARANESKSKRKGKRTLKRNGKRYAKESCKTKRQDGKGCKTIGSMTSTKRLSIGGVGLSQSAKAQRFCRLVQKVKCRPSM